MQDNQCEILRAALHYASIGWPVFPCHAQGKVPLTPRGFKDATTDQAAITAWWQRWPKANIGLPTGPASGVVVIDVDGPAGQRSLASLLKQHGQSLPATQASQTGSGGLHYLFQCPDPPIGNTQGRLGDGIDTRGEGGYIVAPPSIHPNGNAYRWAASQEIAPLPTWIIEALRPKPVKAAAVPWARPAISPPTDDAVLNRASRYLAEMDPAIQGAGGHDRLYAAATALVHGFGLPPQQANELLWAEFNPRCVPPWERADPKQRKDFERKAHQAASKPHDQPKGWLIQQPLPDAIELGGGDPEHGAKIASVVLEAWLRKRHPEVAAASQSPPAATQQPATASQAIPTPPGMVGTLCNWMDATAWKPQPILSLAASLAFWGAVVGRKVRDERDLRSNLYTLGIAHSGAGKEHARRCIKQLCHAAGVTSQLLAGEDVASDSALLHAVGRNPACLFLWDEIGHMIANTNHRQAATYQRAIPVTLTKLFTSASTVFLGKEYASAEIERKDIDQPNACVYGTTNPDTFYSGISPSQIRDGFLGRLLVFATDNHSPKPTGAKPTDPPKELVETVQAWATRRIDPPPHRTGNLDPFVTAWQIDVPTQPEAEAVFVELRNHAEAERAAIIESGRPGGIESLWARAEEQARKVALTVAAGCAFDGIAIGRDVAAWSCNLVRLLTGNLVEAVREQVADSPYEHARNKLVQAVCKSPKPVPWRSISRLILRGVNKRERDSIVADAIESGEVVVVEQPTAGRTARFLVGGDP